MINPDVTCLLQGRLGNNLFQIAATAAYAHRYGFSWAVPTGYNHAPHVYTFGVPVTDHWKDRVVWSQPDFGYTEVPLVVPGTRLRLEGWFQSYRYFDREQEYIRSVLKLRFGPTVNAVALHVRRGDFVVYKTCSPLAVGYYARATSAFVNQGMRDFLVFSDDLPWCREHLPACNRQAQFAFCEETNEHTALSVMAQCHGHIISNSTFGWWGAWLSTRSRMVVCPHHEDWFYGSNKGNNTDDLYPPGWIELFAPPE